MRRLRLADVGAKIVDYDGGKAVMFDCPMCEDHPHIWPFGDGAGTRWKHVNGSTIDDITLAPSYLATCPLGTGGECRLHCFLRGGVLEVLDDSVFRAPSVSDVK